MQIVLHAAAMVPASIPSPDWSGFDIPLPWGTLRIHAYALCILAGIIAGLWLTSVRWARRGAPEGSVWDIAIWAIPFGIIGGRLYHVVSSPDAYFGPGFDGTGDLSLIPQIQRGGLGIWGAVVLGAVGAWIGCRRAGVKLSAFLDAAAPGTAAGPGDRPLGQLLQPGALRRPHHAAVGAPDRRRQPQLPGRHAGGHALPPDVPLRVPVEPRGRADPAGPGPASSTSAAAGCSGSTPCTTRWAGSGSRPCGSTTPSRSASSASPPGSTSGPASSSSWRPWSSSSSSGCASGPSRTPRTCRAASRGCGDAADAGTESTADDGDSEDRRRMPVRAVAPAITGSPPCGPGCLR